VSAALSPFDGAGARERARRQTHARIYAAALAAFARVGFDAASVTEIARVAGVSRPTFYAHFPTREHVLAELQWHKEMEVCHRIAACRTLRETLAVLPDALVDALLGIPGATTAQDMIRLHARETPEASPSPFPLVELLQERFRQGELEGDLAPGLGAAQAAQLCLKSIFGYLMVTPTEIDRAGDLRTLVGLFLA